MRVPKYKWTKYALMCASTLTFTTGCYVEVHESGPYDRDYSSNLEFPASRLEGSQSCSASQQRRPWESKGYEMCFETPQNRWNTNCKGDACNKVKVFVHYMLKEDLGSSNTVTIEAFDNSRYQGSPVSTVQINHFKAQHSGDHSNTDLYLAPGTYYLRAFIADSDDLIVPYQFQGMELLSEKPVGVYGALSSPASVHVYGYAMLGVEIPVHITINQLFKKPGTEQETQARIRVQMKFEEGAAIPESRKVLVQLRDIADLGMLPDFEFEMLTENFKVEGRMGQAEFLSPHLPVGPYMVFVFVDDNVNGHYDEGELAGMFRKSDGSMFIETKERRTATFAIELKAEPNLPIDIL